jgi:hypothetical protein
MAVHRRLASGGIIASVAVMVFAFAPSAGASTLAQTFAYPSASSTIIGSAGFIDSCQAGYFWSASRGDSVTQTFTSLRRIRHVVLDVAVVSNALNGGNTVNWTLSINGKNVDSFVVSEGFTGAIHRDVKFAKIRGKQYTVKLFVTNEVPGGGGSVSLAYADCGGVHSIKLKKY